MPDNALLQIQINNSLELRDPTIINELMDSSLKILRTSENEFREMQNKKWYKRFWEIITFSKDNEKRLAKGIASLSKVQEIVIKMLLMLSCENRQILAFVKGNRETINAVMKRLSSLKKYVILLEKLLSGMIYFTRPKLSDISPNDREIIMFAAWKYLAESDNKNKDVQEYYKNLSDAFGFHDAPNREKFEFKKIGELSDKNSDLLYFNTIADMAFLAGKSPNDRSYKKAIAYVDLSKHKQDLVWQRIKDTEKTKGRQALVNGYYKDDLPEFFIDSEGIDFIEYDEYYPQIREIVGKYANSIIDAECITPATDSEDRISAFLRDNHYIADPKNILAFYDFISIGDFRSQLLITISGFCLVQNNGKKYTVYFDSLTEESKVILCIPYFELPNNKDRSWIYNLIDSSLLMWSNKVNKEKFASMLNDIYNLPKDEIPDFKADEKYEIEN